LNFNHFQNALLEHQQSFSLTQENSSFFHGKGIIYFGFHFCGNSTNHLFDLFTFHGGLDT